MKRQITWVRVSYWAAAIADFLVSISALIPERMGETHYSYPMGLMSAVAFSWGILLLVADRKPLERRWILLPTILVVTLLESAVLHAGLTGIIPIGRMILSSIAVVVLVSLLSYSYSKARKFQ